MSERIEGTLSRVFPLALLTVYLLSVVVATVVSA
jgi:hypothetical protein